MDPTPFSHGILLKMDKWLKRRKFNDDNSDNDNVRDQVNEPTPGTSSCKARLWLVVKNRSQITMSLFHEKQVRVLKLFEHISVAASGEQIPADKIDPRLLTVGELPNSAFFNAFLPEHLDETRRLIAIFYSAKDFDDFMHLAEQARTFVNSTLFAFAAEVAILHRADSKGIIAPPIQEIFADRFVPADTFIRAFSIASTKPAGDESDIIIDVQETGNILDPEYKLAYFREDVGVNAHHWHWHVVYPSVYDSKFFGKNIDRAGEIFYYMHQQICARFRLQSDSRRTLIWRAPGTRYHQENTIARHCCGGAKWLVWGGIILGSRTDLHVQSVTMTAHIYRDDILEQHVRLFRGAMGAEFLFMDDNARPPRANTADECLQIGEYHLYGLDSILTGLESNRACVGYA
ncbi:hemocyanin A chain [Trichonephila clavipes]|nr:hemocyanin A chain [Trichonephila clavipes]